MAEPEAMLETVGVEVGTENGQGYAVHVRMDDDAVYMDIHIDDKVYATLIPWMGLIALSKYIDSEELKLPEFLGAPKKEYLN